MHSSWFLSWFPSRAFPSLPFCPPTFYHFQLNHVITEKGTCHCISIIKKIIL